MLKTAGTTALGLSVLSSVASAQPTEITGCTTITEPGEYVLTQNIEDASANQSSPSGFNSCISIQSSDVTLNGQEHIISRSSGNTNGTGIFAGEQLNDINIENVVLENWGLGITFRRVNESNIMGCSVSNSNFGIVCNIFCDNNLILDNMVHSSQFVGIIVQAGSDGNTIMRNSSNSNGWGFVIARAGVTRPIDNRVIRNTASENNADGIALAEADRNRIMANRFTENADDGIELQSANDNMVVGNTVCNNGDQPIENTGSGNLVRGNRENC